MRSKARKWSRWSVRLELEPLEARTVPAVIAVVNLPQLRAAIQNAGNFDIIQMAQGVYTTNGIFVQAEDLAKNLTIQAAPGASVTLDGSALGDVLRVRNSGGNPGTTVQFQGIAFQSGVSGTPGV